MIPPQNFYISEFVLKGSSLPDPKVKFYLFDRVVNIKKCIPVPYGAKGTIIGIYKKDDELNNQRGLDIALNDANDEQDYLEQLLNSVIEVMFDDSFDGGLKTRSTKPNIYKMQTAWLINITYGLMNAKKTPNFRNVYQPIQNYSKAQPKTSTPNPKAAKTYSRPVNGIVPKADDNQNKFNHSENSPFKILTKNFNFNPTAHEFVPTTQQSHVPCITAPTAASLPMPFPTAPKTVSSNPPNSLNDALKKMLGLSIGSDTTQDKGINGKPTQGPSAAGNAIAPPMPSMEWIESAKSKSREKTGKKPQTSVKSMVILPSNTKKTETVPTAQPISNGKPMNQNAKTAPRSYPAPPRNEPAIRTTAAAENVPSIAPSVTELFNQAAKFESNQNQPQNHYNHRPNQNNNRNYYPNNRNNYNNYGYNKHSNGYGVPPQTNSNYQYNVSLNQQSADIKQFVPLAVARNYQHERTSKLKQHK